MDENRIPFGGNGGDRNRNGVNGIGNTGLNSEDELDERIPSGLSAVDSGAERRTAVRPMGSTQMRRPAGQQSAGRTVTPQSIGRPGIPQRAVRPGTPQSGVERDVRGNVPRSNQSQTPMSGGVRQPMSPHGNMRQSPEAENVRYGVGKNAPPADGGNIPSTDRENKAFKKEKTKKTKKKKDGGSGESANSVMSIIKCMAYITGVFAVAAVISVLIIISANDIFAFSKSKEKIEVTIPENATIEDVAEILTEEGVVKYKFLFKTYAGMRNKDEGFCAGTYEVSPSMNYDKLLGSFVEQTPTGVQWVTIPEGYTTDEIIDLLVSCGIGEREKYVDAINNYDFDYWFIDELGDDWAKDGRIYRLDGYLFPDSYQFYNASSEVTVINKLLTRFEQVFTKTYRTYAENMGYSVDDIITLASIIEKEAGKQSEFNRVSSVFHNRMNSDSFSCLESDATIVYVLAHETGTRPELTSADLELDSPYNTYKYPGLTPGPISNPSNSAILAAMNPEKTDYYYFVSYKDNTYFSVTKAEHDARVAEIAALKSAADSETTEG